MKVWKRKIRGLLFIRRLCSPLFLAVYAIAWFHLCSLCQFGRVRKNLPVLAVCGLFFLVYLCGYLVERRFYRKRSVPEIFRDMELKDNRVMLPGAGSFDLGEVRWYCRKKEQLFLFLKGKRFVWMDMEKLTGKKKEYLLLKLTQRGIFSTFFWKVPVLVLLLILSAAGASSVVRSAAAFNGKLSWVLNDLQDRRSVVLEHDNIYEDGLEGILSDIRTRVDLPETLSLATSFRLHFAPDGTVSSLDTMLYGFDSFGEFTDSYLITYDRKHSEKIYIYLHGSQGAEFDGEKDFEPLEEALSLIPLRETVSGWEEEEYGILYYGVRSWGCQTDGIRYMNEAGIVWLPEEYPAEEIKGPGISVFCPQNEKVEPVRYLYRGIL